MRAMLAPRRLRLQYRLVMRLNRKYTPRLRRLHYLSELLAAPGIIEY